MLEEFKGIRSIAIIKTRRKNILITHIRNKSGNIDAKREGIANLFAKFYKDLHSSKNDERKTRKTAKQDLKTLATTLTMILKTMSKTDTSLNSPGKN